MTNLEKIGLNYSYDGILISDKMGKVVYVNDSYSLITGLKKEEVLFKNLKELQEGHLINRSLSLEAMKEEKVISAVHQYASGKEAFSTAAPIFENGEIVGVINNIRNIEELQELRLEADSSESMRVSQGLEIVLGMLNKDRDFIYQSEAMKETVLLADKVAPFDTTVLITGDSGTGKEVLARHIHKNSERSEKPFIKVNCASIPRELFESELFGYVEGAFTGAKEKGKPGLFEVAEGGTILLDEVGEIPIELQSKLLRVIQEKELRRVGSEESTPINVRILSATNRDLAEEVRENNFREDLFFRLNVFPIHIPPLRNRKEDIGPLIDYFVEKLNRKYKTTKTITEAAYHALENYSYPGNVRELENIIEYVFIMSPEKITIETIPGKVLTDVMINTSGEWKEESRGLDYLMDFYEKTILEDVARRYDNLREAAKVLGIHHSTLHRKLKKYNLELKKPREMNK